MSLCGSHAALAGKGHLNEAAPEKLSQRISTTFQHQGTLLSDTVPLTINESHDWGGVCLGVRPAPQFHDEFLDELTSPVTGLCTHLST